VAVSQSGQLGLKVNLEQLGHLRKSLFINE